MAILVVVSTGTGNAGESLCNGEPNGVIDGSEECETGACCSSECELLSALTVCRESAGLCDLEEACGLQEPAVDAECPEDLALPDETPCSDGLFCTVDDVCSAGLCNGAPRDCADEDVCTDDSCDEEINDCVHADNTAPCDDGDFCTVDDACSEGTCGGAARDCSDEDVCTDDSCDEEINDCVHADNTAPCDDGLFCTVEDTCSNGTCAGVPNACGDENLCTDDSCDEEENACVHASNSDPCDDGEFCTVDDVCVAGDCTGSPMNCSDDDVCTDDVCDEEGNTCTNPDNTASCDDGVFCTVNDTCGDGTCAGVPNPCSDDNSCTEDTCDEDGDQCLHSNLTGDCSDFCVPDGQCEDGVCTGAARDCDDANLCTDDSCDEPGDQCVHAANTAACDDDAFCTVDDTCSGGTCSGSLRDCSDTSVCTDDSCDEAADVCENTNNTATCDDGDECTVDDVCSDGTCGGTPNPQCATTTTTLPQCPVCGDVNEDCEITATDALLVLQAAVELRVCSLSVCDYSGDGKVSAFDALLVLRESVGLPTNPACPAAAAAPEPASTTTTTVVEP